MVKQTNDLFQAQPGVSKASNQIIAISRFPTSEWVETNQTCHSLLKGHEEHTPQGVYKDKTILQLCQRNYNIAQKVLKLTHATPPLTVQIDVPKHQSNVAESSTNDKRNRYSIPSKPNGN